MFVVEVRCPWNGTYISGPYETRAIAMENVVVEWSTSGDLKPHVVVRRATADDLNVLEAP